MNYLSKFLETLQLDFRLGVMNNFCTIPRRHKLCTYVYFLKLRSSLWMTHFPHKFSPRLLSLSSKIYVLRTAKIVPQNCIEPLPALFNFTTTLRHTSEKPVVHFFLFYGLSTNISPDVFRYEELSLKTAIATE